MRLFLLLLAGLVLLGGCRQQPPSAPAAPGHAFVRGLTVAFPDQEGSQKKHEVVWLCSEQAEGALAAAETPFGPVELLVRPQLATRDDEVTVAIAGGPPQTMPRRRAVYIMSSSWIGAPPLNPGEVPADASAVGTYRLTTPVGSASLESEHDFLPPLRLSREGSTLRWEPVAGAVGYAARAVGRRPSGEQAFWFAPALFEEEVASQGAEEALAQGKLFGPDTLECTLPEGFFQEAVVSVHAFSGSQAGQGEVPLRGWTESASYLDL